MIDERTISAPLTAFTNLHQTGVVEKKDLPASGSCPSTVSNNLQIEIASYDLELDRFIVEIG